MSQSRTLPCLGVKPCHVNESNPEMFRSRTLATEFTVQYVTNAIISGRLMTHATYNLLTPLILWAAVTVNFKISPTLTDRARVNGLEVSTEKKKIMTNSTNNINADITMNGQKLEDVTSFNLGEQPCASMAPVWQKFAPGSPQQWQRWTE